MAGNTMATGPDVSVGGGQTLHDLQCTIVCQCRCVRAYVRTCVHAQWAKNMCALGFDNIVNNHCLCPDLRVNVARQSNTNDVLVRARVCLVESFFHPGSRFPLMRESIAGQSNTSTSASATRN